MPETVRFKTERPMSRTQIAAELAAYAEQLGTGTVTLEAHDETTAVAIPPDATFEVELEELSDSSGGPTRLELEFELHWQE